MWKAIGLVLMVAASGCAAHHVPASRARHNTTPTDWAAVRAIEPWTPVTVAEDDSGVGGGLLCAVTDATLTIRQYSGLHAIPRDKVARVTIHVQTGPTDAPWYIRFPVAGAILGGLAGIVVGAIEKDKPTARRSAAVFGVGLFAGLAAGMAYPPRAKYEERLVYIRP